MQSFIIVQLYNLRYVELLIKRHVTQTRIKSDTLNIDTALCSIYRFAKVDFASNEFTEFVDFCKL